MPDGSNKTRFRVVSSARLRLGRTRDTRQFCNIGAAPSLPDLALNFEASRAKQSNYFSADARGCLAGYGPVVWLCIRLIRHSAVTSLSRPTAELSRRARPRLHYRPISGPRETFLGQGMTS